MAVAQTADVIQQTIVGAAQRLGYACVSENSNSGEGKFHVVGIWDRIFCVAFVPLVFSRTGSLATNQMSIGASLERQIVYQRLGMNKRSSRCWLIMIFTVL